MRKCFLLFTCIAGLWATAVQAEQSPIAGHRDPRMRYLAYDPDQVVHLSTAVGATLVVTFGMKETVTAVAVSDSKDLAAMPRGNYLFFKSKVALPPQPVIVLTTSDSGLRRYVFQIVTTDMAHLDPRTPDLYYSVQFTYPADEAAAQAQAAAQQSAIIDAQRKAIQEKASAAQAHNALEKQTRDPFAGPRNWHYVARGDHSLTPLEVFDNGYITVFRFPGNVRIPALFVINPDGHEATANYTVKGNLIEAGSVAARWCLRDGQTALCIWNTAFDPVGHVPGTGTVSPDVQRTMQEAPQ